MTAGIVGPGAPPGCVVETVTMVQLGRGVHKMPVQAPHGWDEVRVLGCVVEEGLPKPVVFEDDLADDVTAETAEAAGAVPEPISWALRVEGVVVASSDPKLVQGRDPCVVQGRRVALVDIVFLNTGDELDLALRIAFRCSQPRSIYLFPPPRWVTRLQAWFGSLFWRSP